MTSSPLIITLDGPAGVGKSTLARRLAEKLGMPFLDTGAMFRFLALKLGDKADTLPESELRQLALSWKFSLEATGEDTRLLVNGQPVGEEIRTDAVSRLASKLGKNQVIRDVLRQAQQQLGSRQSLVAEGRDLGTVVFPDAQVKIFLDARPEVRAERRWKELQGKGISRSLEEIRESIRQRDEQDRNRAIAPLKPAADAILVDSSDLDIEQALAKLIELVHP